MKFYSSPDCTICINGIIAREAVLIDVNENAGKMPIYGWRTKYFHTVADGTVLVGGSIIFNEVGLSYLGKILSGVDPHTNPNSASQNPLVNISNQITNVLSRVEIDQSISTGTLLRLARAKRALIKPNTESSSPAFIGPLRPGADVEIMTLNESIIIRQVHFSSRGTQIDSTRSDNIKMAYSFIGQKLDSV